MIRERVSDITSSIELSAMNGCALVRAFCFAMPCAISVFASRL